VGVFVRATIEADDVLACVRAYFVAHTFVREDVEVKEIGEEGEEVYVEQVDLTLVVEVGEGRAVCEEAGYVLFVRLGVDVLRGDIHAHQNTKVCGACDEGEALPTC
jgi:hypothetical protein